MRSSTTIAAYLLLGLLVIIPGIGAKICPKRKHCGVGWENPTLLQSYQGVRGVGKSMTDLDCRNTCLTNPRCVAWSLERGLSAALHTQTWWCKLYSAMNGPMVDLGPLSIGVAHCSGLCFGN